MIAGLLLLSLGILTNAAVPDATPCAMVDSLSGRLQVMHRNGKSKTISGRGYIGQLLEWEDSIYCAAGARAKVTDGVKDLLLLGNQGLAVWSFCPDGQSKQIRKIREERGKGGVVPLCRNRAMGTSIAWPRADTPASASRFKVWLNAGPAPSGRLTVVEPRGRILWTEQFHGWSIEAPDSAARSFAAQAEAGTPVKLKIRTGLGAVWAVDFRFLSPQEESELGRTVEEGQALGGYAGTLLQAHAQRALRQRPDLVLLYRGLFDATQDTTFLNVAISQVDSLGFGFLADSLAAVKDRAAGGTR